MLIKGICISVVAYFIGNFSTAYYVAKIFSGIDIRNFGSGNAGATNVLRTLGVKAAVIVFLGDALKGVFAVLLGSLIGGEDGRLLAALFVVMGHNWPALLNFRGGKGIATTIGAIAAIKPLFTLVILIIGIGIIFKTKYVSLASISGMILFPLAMIITLQPLKYILLSLALSAMAIYRHRDNIKKLLNGTESKLGQKSRVK